MVFVRGVLPAVLATGAACRLWRRWRGAEPGAWATLALALALAALVALPILTIPLGGAHLAVKGATDAAATVVLLGAAAAAAVLLARKRA